MYTARAVVQENKSFSCLIQFKVCVWIWNSSSLGDRSIVNVFILKESVVHKHEKRNKEFQVSLHSFVKYEDKSWIYCKGTDLILG